MKVFLVLVALLVTVFALPIEERINGQSGWYIPKADGSSEWMDRYVAEQLDVLLNDSDKVSFYLYTKSNPTKGQQIAATASSINASNFNNQNPTRFVIHGWRQDYEDEINTNITRAWLTRGDFNLIIVDWEAARAVDYIYSAWSVSSVGVTVATLISYLQSDHGLSLDTLDVIGHSLGAHVAGYAAKNVGEGKRHTIIGLDPAMPLFDYDKPEKRLAATDAFYVESIATSGGKLGFVQPIGKGAFYPNGGKVQPGCGLDISGACAHSRSVTYYVEAVTRNNFASIKCEDYKDAVARKCGRSFSGAHMGAVTNADMVAGVYYVPISSDAPYGKLKASKCLYIPSILAAQIILAVISMRCDLFRLITS